MEFCHIALLCAHSMYTLQEHSNFQQIIDDLRKKSSNKGRDQKFDV
jgi:hypothetical protein